MRARAHSLLDSILERERPTGLVRQPPEASAYEAREPNAIAPS